MKEVITILKGNYDAYIKHLEETHANHIKRVESAISWFNENVVQITQPPPTISIKTKSNEIVDIVVEPNTSHINDSPFVGHRVKFNGIECMVTANNFKGVPNFFCYFELRPMRSSDNIGNIAGGMKILEF